MHGHRNAPNAAPSMLDMPENMAVNHEWVQDANSANFAY